MGQWQPQDNNKWLSGIAALCIHVALGYLLISGLAVQIVRKTSSVMTVTNLRSDLPLPPTVITPTVKTEVTKKARSQGVASSKSIKSKAAPREAPVPVVKVPMLNMKLTAEKASKGSDNTQGYSDQIGIGLGAGGEGIGTGAGAAGNGNGGLQIKSRAKYVSGRIKNSDYPRAASKAKATGAVTVKFTVTLNGRAVRCRVLQTSGSADLDTTTCRLIEKRFRYQPALGTDGNAIEDVTGWRQDWWFDTKNPNSP